MENRENYENMVKNYENMVKNTEIQKNTSKTEIWSFVTMKNTKNGDFFLCFYDFMKVL